MKKIILPIFILLAFARLGYAQPFDVDITVKLNTDNNKIEVYITNAQTETISFSAFNIDIDLPPMTTMVFDQNPYNVGFDIPPTPGGIHTLVKTDPTVGVNFMSGVPLLVATLIPNMPIPSNTMDITLGTPYVELAGIERTGNAILPIKMKRFTADRYGEARSSILNWETASEKNGSHFDIERSNDGYNFEYIGTVRANGETSGTYSYIDANISNRSNNVFYYRMKLVDLDGSYEYSEIRTVAFEAESVEIKVGPNPTADIISLDIISPEGTENEANAKFFDVAGRMVMSKQVSTNGITQISMQGLSNGMYNLSVEIGGKRYTKSVIKSN